MKMSDILHQNKLENWKQNGSKDLLDNQSMILEFALFDRKIGTESSLGNVSVFLSTRASLFVQSTNQNAQLDNSAL